eukprot:2220190-Rhodomonas_salina.1
MEGDGGRFYLSFLTISAPPPVLVPGWSIKILQPGTRMGGLCYCSGVPGYNNFWTTVPRASSA